MKVLVCGGRNFDDMAAIDRALRHLWTEARGGYLRVIQGGASGADALARRWCMRNSISYENYPADWGAHGKAAGPIRNAQMLAEGRPDLVLAFPGGRGTADMVARARAAGVRVIQPVEDALAAGGTP